MNPPTTTKVMLMLALVAMFSLTGAAQAQDGPPAPLPKRFPTDYGCKAVPGKAHFTTTEGLVISGTIITVPEIEKTTLSRIVVCWVESYNEDGKDWAVIAETTETSSRKVELPHGHEGNVELIVFGVSRNGKAYLAFPGTVTVPLEEPEPDPEPASQTSSIRQGGAMMVQEGPPPARTEDLTNADLSAGVAEVRSFSAILDQLSQNMAEMHELLAEEDRSSQSGNNGQETAQDKHVQEILNLLTQIKAAQEKAHAAEAPSAQPPQETKPELPPALASIMATFGLEARTRNVLALVGGLPAGSLGLLWLVLSFLRRRKEAKAPVPATVADVNEAIGTIPTPDPASSPDLSGLATKSDLESIKSALESAIVAQVPVQLQEAKGFRQTPMSRRQGKPPKAKGTGSQTAKHRTRNKGSGGSGG